MRFAVLGPLAVSADGDPVPLGGRKQRTLLALLLLHPNRVVSRDDLIGALWGDSQPPSAADSLDTYVYRLRRLLGRDRVLRRGGGYLLRVGPGELDADRFELLVAEAAQASDAGDHRDSVATLREALGLWRGPAWADMLDEPWASGEAQRLEQLRLSAVESRIEAELAAGGGAALVPELNQLVTEHPLRERLTWCLMLALYRAGRQADALDVFQAARQRLVQDLGLEPGPGLRELQRGILQHDPSLAGPRLSLLASRLRGRRMLAVAALPVLVAVLAAALALGASAANPGGLGLAAGVSGVVAVQPGAARVSVVTPLAGAPAAVCVGAGSVWVADAGNGTVTRIDPASGQPVERIPVGGDPGSIVSGGGAIWVADSLGATVARIAPATETVTQTITLGGANPDALAFGGGRLWVADASARSLYEIDPATGGVLQTIPVEVTPSAVVFGAGALWVAGYDSATVLKVDPARARVVARVHVGTGPSSLAFGAGALWVANSLDSTVSRIDPAILTVRATIPVDGGPSALAVDGEEVWVASQYSGTLSRIDPRRDAVVAAVSVGGMPTSVIAARGRVWAGVAAAARGHRGGTLVIASTATSPSVDPAFYNRSEPPQFDGLAYDTLITFDHTGGAAGLRLVPDLALTVPAPTRGGRAYAFRLRPGIRYSNGTPLRASDFRRAIERLFRAGSPGADYYTGIIGAAGCMRQPTDCDLSRGIVTDDTTGTVVFHLTAPDPEFLYQLTEQDYTAPIPPGTPDHDMAFDPVPGTGPYRITRAYQTTVRFVRNPYFRQWSPAAQPAGNPNVIVWHFFSTEEEAARAVLHGRADWLYGPVPLPEYHQTAIQSPSQLHSQPVFAVEFLPLDTRLRPFNNILARKALNYAINRDVIAQMYGGPAFATPTCQPLAPGLPGYRRHCPYTSRPSKDGAYSGPDLAHAKHLVALSGTRGEHVTVWGSPDEGYVPPGVPGYVASVLRSLGYRATVHLLPFASITSAMNSRYQLNTNGDWLSDYPDPSSYFPLFFSCGGGNNNGYTCDPALDREMRQAELLELTAPAAANLLWTSIDHTLTSQADWVPTVNAREVDLVSKRLENYEFNPVWGFLADQAWLRKPPAQTKKHPHSLRPADRVGNQSAPFATIRH
jgi:YVTN family beta-propeller protein